jgi:probable rRNA maturation factor
MGVDINDEQGVPLDLDRLRQRLEAGLGMAGCPEAELSVLLTGDERMAQLNETYRGIPKTTDVLSFSLGEEADFPFGGVLGDIVISIPTASRQAAENEASLEGEVETLAFHGLLHLLGHDHETEGWEAWERALKEILPDE